MSTALQPKTTASDIEAVLIQGDLSKLNDRQRVEYYLRVCESVGLNPLTQPFDYVVFQGKLTLYAKKSCTEQLRTIHGVSVDSLTGQVVDDCYVVTAGGCNAKGRRDSATGAVSIASLKGENKCNAMMKAETKAKRRFTLSICGLGLLDDSEVDSIPGAQRMDFTPVAAPPAIDNGATVDHGTGEITGGEVMGAKEFFRGLPHSNIINDEQMDEIRATIKIRGLDRILCDAYQIESLTALPAADFDGCILRIRDYQTKYEERHGPIE